MPRDISENIEIIERIKSNGQFHKYIDFIKFPFYRNVEVNTLINFEFPLTVFIGQNGCGKSSCLHALYGAPKNYTPYNFWFDTKVDPITYYDDQRRRHSFWYSYLDEQGAEKEVIKARIRRDNDPNYWETSRPLAWAGMRSRQSRDTPIEKSVVYLDFRSELSAFDKYFYFGNTRNISSRNKQEFIRRKSASLNKLISEEVSTINTRSGAANSPIRHLTIEELQWISFILGKEYNSGCYLEHQLYRNEGYSVVFRTNYGNYSEAFAGSGEVAIVRLVLKILDAENYSLILLDEPEVSLHPGAQSRLKSFLLEQIILKKHQIVITSHSPSIVKGLPKKAIKVFYQNPSNGRFLVEENLTPEQAFYHIEYPVNDLKNIIVEDKLAKEIIETVLKDMGDSTANLFNVKFYPGGCSVLKKEFMTVFCRNSNSNDYVIFDGDQKPSDDHFDWRILNHNDLTNERLTREIRNQTSEEIRFSIDGGDGGVNNEQRLELLKSYLDFYRENVFYFPELIPEEIIWNFEKARQLVQIQISDVEQIDLVMSELEAFDNCKMKFRKMSQVLYGSDSAENIYATHRLFITSWKELNNLAFGEIRRIIQTIIDNTV